MVPPPSSWSDLQFYNLIRADGRGKHYAAAASGRTQSRPGHGRSAVRAAGINQAAEFSAQPAFPAGSSSRVSIGRALIHHPAILLADEPTGNLDSRNTQEIMTLLRMSNKQRNQTCIVITHDENIALQADRIIAIEDGRISSDQVIRQ